MKKYISTVIAACIGVCAGFGTGASLQFESQQPAPVRPVQAAGRTVTNK